MLSLWRMASCLCLLLISLLTSVKAGDSVPPHQYIPVWDPHPNRPNPIHQHFDPFASSPASLRAVSQQNAVKQASGFEQPLRAGHGPLQLHYSMFQPVSYPLDMPELSHLYTDDSRPADWTAENTAYSGRFKYARIENKPLFYRPEPSLLHNIKEIITRDLASQRIHLKQPGSRYRYTEGVYLWPPLERGEDGHLDMPAGVLEPRLSDVPNTRIYSKPDNPTLFKMDVPMEGQTRHVLAVPARPQSFTTLRHGEYDSALWLFYESRHMQHPGEDPYKTLSFLGAMLLPKQSQHALAFSGVMKKYIPAASGVADHVRPV